MKPRLVLGKVRSWNTHFLQNATVMSYYGWQ